MKKITLLAFSLALTTSGAGPSAAATNVQPFKICEYENGSQCTGWYPNPDTCRDIFKKPGVTDYQLRACLAWSGHGSRG